MLARSYTTHGVYRRPFSPSDAWFDWCVAITRRVCCVCQWLCSDPSPHRPQGRCSASERSCPESWMQLPTTHQSSRKFTYDHSRSFTLLSFPCISKRHVHAARWRCLLRFLPFYLTLFTCRRCCNNRRRRRLVDRHPAILCLNLFASCLCAITVSVLTYPHGNLPHQRVAFPRCHTLDAGAQKFE